MKQWGKKWEMKSTRQEEVRRLPPGRVGLLRSPDEGTERSAMCAEVSQELAQCDAIRWHPMQVIGAIETIEGGCDI